MVGILHRPDAAVSAYWAYSHKMLGMPLGMTYEYKPIFNCTDVAAGRNEVVQEALNKGVEYIFFNDDDVIMQDTCLINLWNRQKDMVTGVYWSKQFPPEPIIFRGKEDGSWDWEGPFLDWKIGDLVRIDAAGCGAVLIKTEIFKKMSKPWFRTDYNSNWQTGTRYESAVTEDIYFYKRAHDLGYELWCDTGVQLQHYDSKRRFFFQIPNDSPQIQQRVQVVEGKGVLVDMGSGEAMRAFPGFTVIRVDGREEVTPDIICPLDHVPIQDAFADMIFSCHAIEHFSPDDVFKVLREWLRILKMGGKIHIITPNLAWAAKRILDGIMDGITMSVFNGGQTNPYDTHKCVFTAESLTGLLTTAKLSDIEVTTSEGGFNLVAKATKTCEY
jgi:predicted SAM-dependent methyltransferase